MSGRIDCGFVGNVLKAGGDAGRLERSGEMDMKPGFMEWDAIDRDAFGRLARMSAWLGPARARPRPYRFLVPVDGGAASLRALHVALQMSGQHPDGELHVLNVQVHAGNDSLDDILERQGLRETAAARGALDKLGEGYRLHLTAGAPAEAIRAYARDAGIAEIVMGSHGAGPLERLVVGSVAMDVAEKSALPVTLVKADCRVGEFPAHWVDWLVPCDGSDNALRALDYLVGHLAHFAEKPRLQLLNVRPDGAERGGPDPLRVDAEAACAVAITLLDAEQVPFSLRVAVGDAATRILETVAQYGCGHVVMGSRGLGPLGGFALGSVSQAVARRAAVPVTLVK
jgi:nucleotide-binding universal stress UspA family protein